MFQRLTHKDMAELLIRAESKAPEKKMLVPATQIRSMINELKKLRRAVSKPKREA